MKILVTGGAGYIGSHVVRLLSEVGEEVVVFDNLSTGFADALIHNERLVVGDLNDSSTLESTFRTNHFSAVLHFAASIDAARSIKDPLHYYRNNASSTISLLDKCIRHGVEYIILSSTAAVYGIPCDGIAAEDSPIAPITPYGASKSMCERIVKDVAHANGLYFAVLRYFNVAGADYLARMGQRTLGATHLIKVCCEAASGRRDGISIFGTDYDTVDGSCIRDYIHVEDVAAAHVSALQYLKTDRQSSTLNVGYGKGTSVKEVIEMCQDVTGVKFPVNEAPRRPGDAPMLIAKSDRIRALLGWKPRYDDLRTIVADSWRWERKLARQKIN